MAGATGLDLDEAERVAFPTDQIEFTAAAGGAVIARYNHVSMLAQVKVSLFFAPPSGLEMRRRRVALWQQAGQGIERANCDLSKPARHAA